MATQQAGDMHMHSQEHDAEDMTTSTGSHESSVNTERYPANAFREIADGTTASWEGCIRVDPRYSDTSSSAQSLPQEDEESRVSSGVPALLAESVSSADVDELEEEDQLGSNGPSTPAAVLAKLSQSQSSSSHASVPMSSAPSSNLASSSSSAKAASESNAAGMAKHSQDGSIVIIPVPSAFTSTSAFVQQESLASQVPKRQRIPRACDSCR
jgi:hypothetical protein